MTRIEEAMLYAGLTQQELSNKTGINKGTISRYINGAITPKSDKAKLIADVTGTNPAWIMGFDVDMELPAPEAKKRELTIEQQMSEMMLNKVVELFHTLDFNQQVRLFEVIRKEEEKLEATK